MITNTVLAAAAEPDAGWGKLSALLLTAGLFWAGTRIHHRILTTKNTPSTPLPSSTNVTALFGVKPQASDPVTPTADPFQKESGEGVSDLDRFVGQRLHSTRPSHIIRSARAQFGASESTIKRAIRRARTRERKQ